MSLRLFRQLLVFVVWVIIMVVVRYHVAHNTNRIVSRAPSHPDVFMTPHRIAGGSVLFSTTTRYFGDGQGTVDYFNGYIELTYNNKLYLHKVGGLEDGVEFWWASFANSFTLDSTHRVYYYMKSLSGPGFKGIPSLKPPVLIQRCDIWKGKSSTLTQIDRAPFMIIPGGTNGSTVLLAGGDNHDYSWVAIAKQSQKPRIIWESNKRSIPQFMRWCKETNSFYFCAALSTFVEGKGTFDKTFLYAVDSTSGKIRKLATILGGFDIGEISNDGKTYYYVGYQANIWSYSLVTHKTSQVVDVSQLGCNPLGIRLSADGRYLAEQITTPEHATGVLFVDLKTGKWANRTKYGYVRYLDWHPTKPLALCLVQGRERFVPREIDVAKLF